MDPIWLKRPLGYIGCIHKISDSRIQERKVRVLRTERSGGCEEQKRDARGAAFIAYLREVGRYACLDGEREKMLAQEIQTCKAETLNLFSSVRELQPSSTGEPGAANEEDETLIEEVLLQEEELTLDIGRDETLKTMAYEIQKLRARLRQAIHEMVQSNLRLVISMAKAFVGRGVPLADLVQEGNMGLIKAAIRFDPRKGCRFSTYASWWIRQAIQRGIEHNGRTIRIPANTLTAMNRYRRVVDSVDVAQDLEPEQIMEKANMSQSQWATIQNHLGEPLSLDATMRDEGPNLMDQLADPKTPLPSDTIAQREASEKVRSALKVLSPREESVIKRRFGIGCRRPYTLDEIGRQLGVSRERVRQIEQQALRKLKKTEVRNGLKHTRDLHDSFIRIERRSSP
jgi:RNA polymerase primary sigma factor